MVRVILVARGHALESRAHFGTATTRASPSGAALVAALANAPQRPHLSPTHKDPSVFISTAYAQTAPAPAAIRAFALDRMAGYMVPRYIELRDRLEYTEVGKVKRETLGLAEAPVWDARNA